jgi:hypothetical protein
MYALEIEILYVLQHVISIGFVLCSGNGTGPLPPSFDASFNVMNGEYKTTLCSHLYQFFSNNPETKRAWF